MIFRELFREAASGWALSLSLLARWGLKHRYEALCIRPIIFKEGSHRKLSVIVGVAPCSSFRPRQPFPARHQKLFTCATTSAWR